MAAADAEGVPVIAPVDVFSASPEGNPGDIAKVIGEVPPVVVTGVKAEVASVAVRVFVAIATEAVKVGEISRVKVLVAVSEIESVTVIVCVVTAALTVGVPVIAPVAAFIDKPAGRVGDIEYVRGAVPPELTTGVNEVAALN